MDVFGVDQLSAFNTASMVISMAYLPSDMIAIAQMVLARGFLLVDQYNILMRSVHM